MKNFGIVLIILGALLIAFPTLIGGLVFGSVAVLLSLFATVALVLSLIFRNIFFSIISLVFLAASFKVMDAPLYYVGWVMVISAGLQMMFKRDRRTVIPNVIILALGLFAVWNSQAALATTGMILGVVLVGLGMGVYFFLGAALRQPKNFCTRVEPGRGSVRVQTSTTEYEDAKFTEIDE